MTNSHLTNGADVLSALLLCGLMGLLGQGARAAVGLKKANALGGSAQYRDFGVEAPPTLP